MYSMCSLLIPGEFTEQFAVVALNVTEENFRNTKQQIKAAFTFSYRIENKGATLRIWSISLH